MNNQNKIWIGLVAAFALCVSLLVRNGAIASGELGGNVYNFNFPNATSPVFNLSSGQADGVFAPSGMKFGSGTESNSFGGWLSSDNTTSTIANAGGTLATFGSRGTVTTTFDFATSGTCMRVRSATGTRVFLTWIGGVGGAWSSSATDCQ